MFDEHSDHQYGKIGIRERAIFKVKAKALAIDEILKDVRK